MSSRGGAGKATPWSRSLNQLTRDVHKQEYSVLNRLRSIAQDAEFVRSLRTRLTVPAAWHICANLRTGAYYVDTAATAPSHNCYFKSTDGHVGEWTFSLTRLNLPLLEAVCQAGGGVVVDATKAGKRFPDALTRTLPIWCAVMNAVRLGPRTTHQPSMRQLLPPWIPASEAALLQSRIAEWAASIPPAVTDAIRAASGHGGDKPLMTHFMCQPACEDDDDSEKGTDWYDDAPAARSWSSDSALHVIAVSASRAVPPAGDARSARAGWRYHPGAGDDAEHWAAPLGLTPSLFHTHCKTILASATDEECCDTIRRLARETTRASSSAANITPSAADIAARGSALDADSASPWLSHCGVPVRCGGSDFVRVYRPSTASTASTASSGTASSGDAHPLPAAAIIVTALSAADAAPAALAAADERGAACTVSADGVHCLHLALPTTKAVHAKYKLRWITHAFPAVTAFIQRSALMQHSIVAVVFDDPACASAATVVAAAAAAERSTQPQPQLSSSVAAAATSTHSKSALRTLISLSALATGAASVDRAHAKMLNAYYLSASDEEGEGEEEGQAAVEHVEEVGDEEDEEEEEARRKMTMTVK